MTYDCVKSFFYFYVKGDLISAVNEIIPSPDISYDTLQSPDVLLQNLINFIDAAVFGTIAEANYQNKIVSSFITINPQKFEIYREAVGNLTIENYFVEYLFGKVYSTAEKIPEFFPRWLIIEKETLPLGNFEIELMANVPEKFRSLMKFHLRMAWGWQKFKNSKPLYISNFSKEYYKLHPWYPLQYSLPIPSLETCPLDKIPIIFFEPIKEDLSPFLQKLKGRPAIFAFTTIAIFFQMLQFPAFADSLCESEHLIYILELYPNQQFAAQDFELIRSKELHPIFFALIKPLEDYATVLIQALEECLALTKNELYADTVEGNWVYEVANRMLLSIQQKRLGLSRIPALYLRTGQVKWYDVHKGPVPLDKPLGPEMEDDQMKILLSKLANKRVARPRIAKEKLLIAHVTSQIIFGGHAPSRLLESLVLDHNAEKFKVHVIVTELLKEHPLEYPYNFYTSGPSKERGVQILNEFHKMGVQTIINQKNFYYFPDAVDLSRLLHDYNIDVVVFHGPDIINLMTTQMVDVPLRVLLEHGTQPAYPGFDLAIVSSLAAVELYQELYKKIHTQAVALPFAVDVRKGWLAEPFTRTSLSLPEDGLIMTTISTKLDGRLNDEVCHTIATILKRVPKACYAPIGAIKNPDRIKKIFAEHGVADRLYPLGNAICPPSQYVRCMHLYLNEFPFGGCLAILDAMAAGCPVVTMYDTNGPQQSRYGGHYIGLDRAITSGKKEEYIELACKLLTDPEMYKEWSQHTIRQYEKFADEKGYVRSFEKILLDAYNNKIGA